MSTERGEFDELGAGADDGEDFHFIETLSKGVSDTIELSLVIERKADQTNRQWILFIIFCKY